MRENYEAKEGKHIAFRAKGQERFTRSKTLGAEYTEQRIKERLQGITTTVSKAQKSAENSDSASNNLAQGSASFAHWAKLQNLKSVANIMNYLTENNILNYDILLDRYESLKHKNNATNDRIKAIEKRIKELDVRIKDIEIYRKTKPIVDKGSKVVFKEKYRREHESEFILFTAAEQSLKPHLKDGKPPMIKPLRAEINQLIAERKSLFDCGKSRIDFEEIQKLSKAST
jgi:hypothetical protein